MIRTLYDRPAIVADDNQGTRVGFPDMPRSLAQLDQASLTPLLNAGIAEGRASAVAAPGNIVIFSGDMSAEHHDYVTNSLIFSDLAATQQTKSIGHPLQRRKAWYMEKTRIMKGLGWSGFGDSVTAFSAKTRKFTMDQAGLEILGAALAAAAVPGLTGPVLLDLAKDAIDKLREGGESLRLFERNTRDHQDGKFNIAVCKEVAPDKVLMVSTNIYFVATHGVTNILFWEWQTTDVDVQSASDRLELNERRFLRKRDELADILDDYASDEILTLPLRD